LPHHRRGGGDASAVAIGQDVDVGRDVGEHPAAHGAGGARRLGRSAGPFHWAVPSVEVLSWTWMAASPAACVADCDRLPNVMPLPLDKPGRPGLVSTPTR
jgi:hypothetical protein